ncbi:MAG: hypothetical protein JJ875_14045 [Roseibium sp.]|nr:hypothetical protein [Roseibium sp.]
MAPCFLVALGFPFLLPSQPEAYYTEYVHPTPGVIGQGPQRVIQGQGGGLYYTPDHYGTFIPLN